MTSNSLHIKDFRTQIPGALIQNTWQFPDVTTTNSHGRIIHWQANVRLFRMRPDIILPDVPEDAFVEIADNYFDCKPLPGFYGWIKIDTGIDKSNKTVATIVTNGKNLLKASATNVWTQALRDAYGLYNTQAKKSTNVINTNVNTIKQDFEFLPPMLAQTLKDQKVQPVISDESPVYVQPKYNGVRAITTWYNGTVIMYSRRKNLYPGFGYIKSELEPILRAHWESGQKLYIDGELYKHGVALQDISGYARREDKSDDTRLDYMVYDCFLAGETQKYTERQSMLDEIFDTKFQYAKPVETLTAHSMEEVDNAYRKYLAESFEGAMVRLDEPYRYSLNEYHSKVLLKMKPTHDAEFEVSGWETGLKGKAAGALMIICTTGEKNFPVTPAMELPDRIALARKMTEIEPNGKTHFINQWLGQKIIVYYDEMSKDNLPQRARTKLEKRTWD